MGKANRKLLTIITESALESLLLPEFERLGAHGYTVTDARGKGSHGTRSAAWDQSSNIRIEILCDEATAETIATHLQTHYYDNFAIVLFMSDVSVLRPEKF